MLCVSLFTRSLHAFHWFPKASFVFRSLSTPTQYLLYRTYTQFKALRLMPTTHPPSNKKNAHHFVHRSLNIIEWTLMLGMRPGHSASMLRNRGSDSILRSVDHLFTRDETSLVRSPPFHSAHLHSPPLPKDQEGGGRRFVDVWVCGWVELEVNEGCMRPYARSQGPPGRGAGAGAGRGGGGRGWGRYAVFEGCMGPYGGAGKFRESVPSHVPLARKPGRQSSGSPFVT